MFFFKLTNPDEGKWENVKNNFKEDLKKIEERFRQLDNDFFAKNFISQNIETRTQAEDNLKKLLAHTTYEKDMITKVQINYLNNLDKTTIEEIEMVARKIAIAVEAATSIAYEVGVILWDANYRKQMLDMPLNQVEAEINNKIATVKEKNSKERLKIFNEGEEKKQQIIANAINARESFAQGYVNQLLTIGRAELENKIQKTAIKEIEEQEKKE